MCDDRNTAKYFTAIGNHSTIEVNLIQREKKIVVTGGGTGGHVFPALAICEELIARGFKILYVGSQKGLEARLVPEKKIPFFFVRSGAIKNQSFLNILRTFSTLISSILWSIRLLLNERPVAVIGVGGYVSFPISIAAWLIRIPLYLQEQNVSVGITNRILGRFSKRIFLGFNEAERYFPKSKCIVTGNPIRKDFFVDNPTPYNPKKKFLLVIGGSQGAHAINEAICLLLEKLNAQYEGLSILHQTGDLDYEFVRSSYEKYFKGNYVIMPFISEVAKAYAKASLVIARAGALTVSEIIQMGRPTIFIPYPRRGQNDQTSNAYFMKSSGVAEVVEQGNLFHERLWTALIKTFDPEVLLCMSAGFSKLRRPVATATIGGCIIEDMESSGIS